MKICKVDKWCTPPPRNSLSLEQHLQGIFSLSLSLPLSLSPCVCVSVQFLFIVVQFVPMVFLYHTVLLLLTLWFVRNPTCGFVSDCVTLLCLCPWCVWARLRSVHLEWRHIAPSSILCMSLGFIWRDRLQIKPSPRWRVCLTVIYFLYPTWKMIYKKQQKTLMTKCFCQSVEEH